MKPSPGGRPGRQPGNRLAGRLAILARAAAHAGRRRRRPEGPRRILVAHHLLLGDTLMLTPLLARLRARHPEADIAMTVPPALLPLYAGRPYGVRALPWDPRDRAAFALLRREAGFELACVPGDNRHALLARALDARWIVALAGDRPGWKNRACDELVPMPEAPTALSDLFASLAGPPAGEAWDPAAWPAPPCDPFDLPGGAYAVLHVGAGSPLRHWAPERWRALADWLAARGIRPVWAGGPGEADLVAAVDPQARHPSFAGRLDLAQLWRLLAGARLLVCLDSGVSHLAKLAGAPTVVLYGPGSPVLFGPGRFFRDAPFAVAWDAAFPCRDQRTLFRRELGWVRRCQRGPEACAREGRTPRCMEALGLDAVRAAAEGLLAGRRP